MMADITISESGMIFGPFPEETVFHIEDSTVYKDRFRPNGIKTCEFLLRRDQKLYFIEAKTSCPNQIAANTDEEKRRKYEEYIHDIVQKMRDSLSLYTSMLLNRNKNEELSAPMNIHDLGDLEIQFILVVKSSRPEWLVPFSDKLTKVLKNEIKIWGIPKFLVITEELARRKRLIT